MKPKAKHPEEKANPRFYEVAETTYPQKRPENQGLFGRFLDWIARGADKSDIGGRACPS